MGIHSALDDRDLGRAFGAEPGDGHCQPLVCIRKRRQIVADLRAARQHRHLDREGRVAGLGEPRTQLAVQLIVGRPATAVRDDAEWRRLAELIGGAALDERFASAAARKGNEDELDALVTAWTRRNFDDPTLPWRAGLTARFPF